MVAGHVVLRPAAAAGSLLSARGTQSLVGRSGACQLGAFQMPPVVNQAMRTFARGSPERALLQGAITDLYSGGPVAVPCVVNGKEVYAKEAAGRPKSAGLAEAAQQACGDHQRRLCSYAQATEALIDEAIEGALAAKGAWQAMPFADRCAIFLRAADLLTSTSHGYRVMAATMAGQGKNAWQAEIDAYAELADFWRFNCHFAQQIYAEQPLFHASNTWNRMEYRPLDGFVLAISPFNFTAIGGNLPCAPALMGNVVVWKPSASAILSNYLVYRVLLDAGLPPGVIQFVPGPAKAVAGRALAHAQMGGVHFTGSTTVFQGIWQEVGINIGRYASYPRLVGETGGKNFHFVHASADLASVVHNTIRGAFEYQGQKCSATSRLYLPSSMWPAFSRMLTDELAAVGLPRDVCAANGGAIDDDAFGAFCGPVINREAYDRIKGYIDRAREEGRAGSSGRARLFYGGACDDSRGFFIEPTVIVAEEASYETMTEEIFGPVLTVHLYPEGEYAKHLHLAANASSYALTGSLFARDRTALIEGSEALRGAAGNFYINDKSTGAVVGQQAFGGGRLSGTNDKAGSSHNLLRWVSPRTIKETFVPLSHWSYPSNRAKGSSTQA